MITSTRITPIRIGESAPDMGKYEVYFHVNSYELAAFLREEVEKRFEQNPMIDKEWLHSRGNNLKKYLLDKVYMSPQLDGSININAEVTFAGTRNIIHETFKISEEQLFSYMGIKRI